jgi:hypothetical protein
LYSESIMSTATLLILREINMLLKEKAARHVRVYYDHVSTIL